MLSSSGSCPRSLAAASTVQFCRKQGGGECEEDEDEPMISNNAIKAYIAPNSKHNALQ